MSFELAERTLVDRRNGLFGWAAGLTLYVVLIVSLFPTVRDSASLSAAFDEYPDVLKELLGGEDALDLTSGAGFLQAELFSLMLPLLLAVVAIGIGAAIATDEESGFLGLVLSTPVSRSRLILERAATITISVTALTGVVMIVLLIAEPIVDLGLGTSNLFATGAAIAVLVILHGLIALSWGAATGNRGAAIGVATAAFVAGYVISAFSALISWLEPAEIFSPYHLALGSNPLRSGWASWQLLALIGACFAMTAAAITVFERRDLS